jgi:hypothetical protein
MYYGYSEIRYNLSRGQLSNSYENLKYIYLFFDLRISLQVLYK